MRENQGVDGLVDGKFLRDAFAILCRWVEYDQAILATAHPELKNHCPPPSWWQRWHWRSRTYGLVFLDFRLQTEPDLYLREQFQKAKELYLWWNDERPLRTLKLTDLRFEMKHRRFYQEDTTQLIELARIREILFY